MPALNDLQFQLADDASDSHGAVSHRQHDNIDLNEDIDEGKLDTYWDQVVRDVESDPSWFDFAEK
ncbi:hypothetical protein HGB25_00035 [Candidatus Saccharibacteria bacterium]|nr:hypothetical protein [Candidatus Saccharibacteria bacterium]